MVSTAGFVPGGGDKLAVFAEFERSKGVRYYEERSGLNGPQHGTSSVKEFTLIL
jgi:hypothetical protein